MSITIIEALKEIKLLINNAIKSKGASGKASIIRSSKPIMNIHNAVKSKLIELGIDKSKILPHLNHTKPELKLSGFIKFKNQDICVEPSRESHVKEVLKDGVLTSQPDFYGHKFIEKILSINVRSQLSSLAKNFDTLYERTILEAINLHMRCPKMCLGEVYLLAVPEYDSDAVKKNKVSSKSPSTNLIEAYIRAFQKINNRNDHKIDNYKYESVCLLIVDFFKKTPKLFKNNTELYNAGYISRNFNVNIDDLSWDSFFERLLKMYKKRFKRVIP